MPKTVGDISDLEEAVKTLPQKLVIALFDFQQSSDIKHFAKRWDCPVGDATVDLFAVFQWMRDFFNRHSRKLNALLKDSGGDAKDGGLAARYQRARIQIAE